LHKELSQQKEEEKEKAGRASSIMYGNKQSTVHPCSHEDCHWWALSHCPRPGAKC